MEKSAMKLPSAISRWMMTIGPVLGVIFLFFGLVIGLAHRFVAGPDDDDDELAAPLVLGFEP